MQTETYKVMVVSDQDGIFTETIYTDREIQGSGSLRIGLHTNVQQ